MDDAASLMHLRVKLRYFYSIKYSVSNHPWLINSCIDINNVIRISFNSSDELILYLRLCFFNEHVQRNLVLLVWIHSSVNIYLDQPRYYIYACASPTSMSNGNYLVTGVPFLTSLDTFISEYLLELAQFDIKFLEGKPQVETP